MTDPSSHVSLFTDTNVLIFKPHDNKQVVRGKRKYHMLLISLHPNMTCDVFNTSIESLPQNSVASFDLLSFWLNVHMFVLIVYLIYILEVTGQWLEAWATTQHCLRMSIGKSVYHHLSLVLYSSYDEWLSMPFFYKFSNHLTCVFLSNELKIVILNFPFSLDSWL